MTLAINSFESAFYDDVEFKNPPGEVIVVTLSVIIIAVVIIAWLRDRGYL